MQNQAFYYKSAQENLVAATCACQYNKDLIVGYADGALRYIQNMRACLELLGPKDHKKSFRGEIQRELARAEAATVPSAHRATRPPWEAAELRAVRAAGKLVITGWFDDII